MAEDRRAFCARAASLAGERPEAYVGSAEHLRDIEGLVTVAPEDIRAQLEAFRDFVAGGAVHPSDPDSNLTEHWPAPIQAAVKEVTDYIATHC